MMITTHKYPKVKFKYLNWRREEHEYVIEPESIEFGHYSAHGHTGSVGKETWVLHGQVVTRDGDPRPNMGTRRRTFVLNDIREVEELHI